MTIVTRKQENFSLTEAIVFSKLSTPSVNSFVRSSPKSWSVLTSILLNERKRVSVSWCVVSGKRPGGMAAVS